MKLPTVGQCCCCVDLILGGKILGWLGIVSGCLSFISSIQHPKLLVQACKFIAVFFSAVHFRIYFQIESIFILIPFL